MSAFTRVCPQCGEISSAAASACSCGHIYEADTDSLEAVQMVSQEEEAYEAYLAARLDQARQAAEKAIKLLSQNPADRQKVDEADRANRALAQINSEYEQQLAILESAQTDADQAQRETQRLRLQQDAETRQKLIRLETEKQKTRALAERRARLQSGHNVAGHPAQPLVPPKIVSLSSPSISAARAREQRSSPSTPAVAAPRAVTRARSGRLRQDASEAIRARRAAQQLIAQKAESLAAKRPNRKTMPPKMRESTRDQGEQAVTQSRRSSSRISGNLAAAVEALDTRLSKMKTAPANSVPPKNKMECPNCTAALSPTAKRCGCGYEFRTSGESMPGLSLNAKDLQDLF